MKKNILIIVLVLITIIMVPILTRAYSKKITPPTTSTTTVEPVQTVETSQPVQTSQSTQPTAVQSATKIPATTPKPVVAPKQVAAPVQQKIVTNNTNIPNTNINNGSSLIYLNTYSGNPGIIIKVGGRGFQPNENVTVQFREVPGENDSNGVIVTADRNGSFTGANLVVPQRSADIYKIDAVGNNSQRTFSINFAITGYYPKIDLSSYYIMSNEDVVVHGTGFVPNERVQIFLTSSQNSNQNSTSARTPVATLFADANGKLNGTIPFSPQETLGTTQSYQLVSEVSRTSIKFKVVYGKYYPQITPNSYYVWPGELMTLNGVGFAPNENVQVFLNTSQIATVQADSSGNINLNFNAPPYGYSFDISAEGALSRAMSTRTVTLAQNQ